MAYMRGDYYLWSDDTNQLHIWVADGYDGWDDTGWCCGEDGNRSKGFEKAGGVCIPENVMDEFVLMRLAELIQDGKVTETIERFLGSEGHKGNFGGALLEKNVDALKQALSEIKLAE